MNNLYVCIISSKNNNKQYLVSYFYKHVAFLLRVFLKKELARSVVVHTFLTRLAILYMKLCNDNIRTNPLTFIYIEIVMRLVLFVVLL